MYSIEFTTMNSRLHYPRALMVDLYFHYTRNNRNELEFGFGLKKEISIEYMTTFNFFDGFLQIENCLSHVTIVI